ncbi:Amidophosphoribosyltransferase [Lachnospiraceae bacterium TWA4]|nr:Amidophosphoribosyltransferase [Lachnospiraceae bacterium TWA4]
MAVHGDEGFQRAIHNIQNSPFRTKFERDVAEMQGNLGIGCISDYEPQPLLIQSHLGSFAITTVGKINNQDELLKLVYDKGHTHFQEMSGGQINATELIASLICKKDSIVEGIQYVQEIVDGSMTLVLMTKDAIYGARDRLGRTPLMIGKKEDDSAYCVAFESFSYINLGYRDYKELGPAEIVKVTPDKVEVLSPAREEMKICSFLWVYYGYPTSAYEGINVEAMRYNCGSMLAKRDAGSGVEPDIVAGVPDSGIAHAIGYANESGIPYARPFIKYTPTWPRSFMPTNQAQRNLIAKMKLIPVKALIENKKLLLIDDSIVRGTQLRETTEFLYQSGAKEVHIRPACPPLLYGCKYLNFSRSKSEMDLITRRIIKEREGDHVSKELLDDYATPDSKNYKEMLDEICKIQNFTTLRYHRLDDLEESIGLPSCKLCTYCFNGKE